MPKFEIASKYKMSPNQADAVGQLLDGLKAEKKDQTLLGVTGSGKTFVMANIVEQVQKPTLILAHNKTLAAQLYSEFKEFFPQNAVKYFVSYYDYYMPESYIPQRDLYIEKESEINETIEKYRNAATQALLSRPDTLIVASVSCIYGLGTPEDYQALARDITVGQTYSRDKFLRHLSDMQYERTEIDFTHGLYRVRGDTVEVYLTASDEVVRVEYYGDEIEQIKIINPVSAEIIEKPNSFKIYPAKHFVTPYESLKEIFPQIREDMKREVEALKAQGKQIEAYRLEQRVNFDLEMMQETGYCSGIENYSRYIDRRKPGSPPSTLLNYFPDDYLLFVDESHITLPQVRGMYHGDRSRKETLVQYGFRLQAALDNRPLKFNEFQQRIDQTIYLSATPDEFEISLSGGEKVELLIRPTGLLDPLIDIRPATKEMFAKLKDDVIAHGYNDMPIVAQVKYDRNQIDDLIVEIRDTIAKGHRVLVTTLTKRMAEDLASYLIDIKVKVTYIHSDLDAIKRVEILRDLRIGKYDVLIGINLLREGLDLPEVSLVAILDADKEGFLRSKTSLTQTIGRAARHSDGKVIMYAQNITASMQAAIDETRRRRTIQEEFNREHGITPTTIKKDIRDLLVAESDSEEASEKQTQSITELNKRADSFNIMEKKEKKRLLEEIETQMNIFADTLEFEKAAELRDLLKELKL